MGLFHTYIYRCAGDAYSPGGDAFSLGGDASPRLLKKATM